MQQNQSWKTSISSATQEILWARHLSLPYVIQIQFTPPPLSISLRSILILKSHLGLSHSLSVSPSAFTTKTLYALPSPQYVPCLNHLTLLDFISQIIFHAEYNHKQPCYAKSSGPLLPHPSLVMVQLTARLMASLHNGTTLKKTVWSKL